MDLHRAVVVITGASSGIGRATARELAARGSSVVVAARREDPLRTLVDECEQLGVEALAVPTDVTDAAAVEHLAGMALARFGRVDAWVNNAGVYLVGRFDQTPARSFERVLDTNFMGVVHGCRAILPHLQERGRGVIVNTASIDAHVPAPTVAAYVASKWALLGFSESLRQELRHLPDVHVAVVSPAAIDTPLWQHAGNHSGRPLRAVRPTYAPEDVAAAIVGQIERPRREVIVGAMARMIAVQRRVAPAVSDRMFALQIEHDQFEDGVQAATDGNLFAPVAEGTEARGGWQTVPSRVRRAAVLAGAAAGAAGVAALVRRDGRSRG